MDHMKRLIPAYTWHGTLATRLDREQLQPGDLVILNPSNGPVPDDETEATNLRAAVATIETKGAYPLGYVALNYGRRDLESFLDDVLRWNATYKVRNVFFDEMPSHWTSGHIGRLTSLVKRVPSPSPIRAAFNPGTPITAAWRTVPEAVVVTSEGPVLAQFNKNVGTRAALVHSSQDPTAYNNIVKAGYEYGYVTSDTPPNPWDNE